MSDSFLGELRLMGFPWAPKGWALCNGQFLPINQNQALFSLLGTMYGGDGRTTFQLPDLRGRTPMHVGQGWTQGQVAGSETVTLSQSQMAAHTHAMMASAADGDTVTPTGNVLSGAANAYGNIADLTTTEPTTLKPMGGSQPHQNLSPYLVLNWCIALIGIFPSRN